MATRLRAGIETDTFKGFDTDDLERTLKRHANRADPNGPFASAVPPREQLKLIAAVELFHGRSPTTHGRIHETNLTIIASAGVDFDDEVDLDDE